MRKAGITTVSLRFEVRTASAFSIDDARCDITEQRPCAFPVVYGFVRLPGGGNTRRNALETALRTFCVEHELTLGGVFVERAGTASSSSPAFAGLLATLTLPDIYGVVMPSAVHLGRGGIATSRRNQLKRIGARLLLMRGGRKQTRTSTEP
jgi:hypothetical protein